MIARIVIGVLLSLSLAAQQRVSLDGEWTIQGKPVTVPAAFETASGVDFDGVAQYRRPLGEVLQTHQRGARVRVEFAAVATHATVFCNGQQVGQHLGGWTPFWVDITDALNWDGRDVLEVRVDEKVGHNTQGFLPIIQPHFGGIWQSVTLCLDDGPVIDRLRLFLFGDGQGKLQYEVPVLGAGDGVVRTRVTVVQWTPFGNKGDSEERPLEDGSTVRGSFHVRGVQPWAPGAAKLYKVKVTLSVDGVTVDEVERRVGFRSLRAEGTRILWNDSPLQLRGILHWGYSPPYLAPPTDPAYWRRQLTDFQRLGFNCIKCCLWVPPACVYDLCDELGMLVWQEYPTWHPQMDQAHKQELLTEYGEFFAHDRSHPSVAFRSITCETGQGADLDVVTALFQACKAACPDTLVVDDSSWIGWQRITDFWDEHPYGNNSWFPGRLEDFKRHIAEKGDKPLLLGECIAADTWSDQAVFRAVHGKEPVWWRPLCWDSQIEAEKWLAEEFGQETVDSLLPLSLEFAMRNRKFQIEQLRLSIPDAGYVVSVARDFAKARMGLYDDQDQLKWQARDWAWHRDTMLCLDLPWNSRALRPMAQFAPVRVSHFGRGKLEGNLRIWSEQPKSEVNVAVSLEPGQISEPVPLSFQLRSGELERVIVHAELTGTHQASNNWPLWVVPTWAYRGHSEVTVARALTAKLLDEIVAGARVLLLAGDRPGSPRTEGMWFLKGAPFAPAHPIHRILPREALLDLSSFDLESGRVMPWEPWRDQVDPILAFWETHDISDTRFHLHAFDTRIGNGRLLATTLNLDDRGELHSLGFHVRYLLEEHLASGPAAARELSPATIAALRAKLAEKKLDLPVWRFRMDPDDEGRAANWHEPRTDVTTADWRDLKAGSHWENQGEDLKHFTGIAWYRVDVDIPADWQHLEARAVFEGVDDSFHCWLDGNLIGTYGDPATMTTIWLEQQTAKLGPLAPGRHTLILRVVDHQGAGGLWKPVFLTTGPTGDLSRLLH